MTYTEISKLVKNGIEYNDLANKLNISIDALYSRLNRHGIKKPKQKTTIDKICLNCGKKFTVKISSDKKYNHKFCNKSCSATYNNKKRGARSKETKEKISNSLAKNNKIIKICLNCSNEFLTRNHKRKFCSRTCSDKGSKKFGWINMHKTMTFQKWSDINKKAYAEGRNYVAGGTTKWYDYKNIRVQGTYELRTCYLLDEMKRIFVINDWEYTNDRFKYLDVDNKQRTYLVDFKIFNTDGTFYYLEIKGYEKDNDKLKWQAVRNKGYELIVWFNKDIIKNEKKYLK